MLDDLETAEMQEDKRREENNKVAPSPKQRLDKKQCEEQRFDIDATMLDNRLADIKKYAKSSQIENIS